MKICILSREYPPGNHVGGIGTYSFIAASLLAKNNHEVHVVTYGEENACLHEEGVLVHRIPMLTHHLPTLKWLYYYRHAYRTWLPTYLDLKTWARTAASYFKNRLFNVGFDIIEYPETMGEGAYLPPRKNGKMVCRIHFSPLSVISRNPLEKMLIRRLERLCCTQAKRIVTPSKYVAEVYAKKELKIESQVIVSRNPIQLWPHPVDFSAKKATHLLFAGRIEHRKGLHILLEALKLLTQSSSDITLRIAGSMFPPTNTKDQEAQSALTQYLSNNGNIHQRIKFPHARGDSKIYLEYMGQLSYSEIFSQYDWAGLFILPSLEENYPYVAIEALSRGCYVLGSRVGGIPEIINSEERGLLFSPGDPADLARKLDPCLAKANMIKTAAQQNAEYIQHKFSPARCYERLMQSYEFSSYT